MPVPMPARRAGGWDLEIGNGPCTMRNGGFPVLRKICYTLGAAAAAGAMVVSGFAAAGAATTACGKKCLDVGFVDPGLGSALLASNSLTGPKGTLVRLVQGSDGLATEDFVKIAVGTVVPTYCTATGQPETGSLFTSDQCELLVADGYSTDEAYELAFSPNNGGPEDECIGATSSKPGSAVRLEPCGASAGTVLISTRKLPGGRVSYTNSVWMVNGDSDNFSNPNVLTDDGTYPSNPTWAPAVYNGKRGIDTQEVCATTGPYDGATPTCSRAVKILDPDNR